MEASPRQLGIEEDGPGAGSVRVLDDRLVIERLEVADERAARLVRERYSAGQPAPQTVAKAIEIGARVLDSEGTAANVDYVKAELERGIGPVAERLGELVETGNEELAERLAGAFGADRSDSVQNQIKAILQEANEAQRTAIARQFNAEDGSNPLSDFKAAVTAKVADAAQRSEQQAELLREAHTREAKEMREQIAALKTEVARLTERREGDEAVAEAEAAGTRKGFSFEERVDDAIGRIASARGDASQHTGAQSADGGGKKGDTVVELRAASGPAQGRIVFECKDRKLSKKAAWDELNEGMAARSAAFGVLVVAGEENVPSGREQLTEYEGNKLIVAVDREEPDSLALDVAYRLAAARVAMAREADMTVDAAAVRDAAEEALSCLKQAQTIRNALTGIKTSSDKARTGLDEMVEAVRARLERIDALIEVAEGDAGAEPGDAGEAAD